MDEKELKQAKRILEAFFAEVTSSPFREKFQGWFAWPIHREEKDAALREIWDERVTYDPYPDAYTRDSLKEIRTLLGFPEEAIPLEGSPKKRTPLRRWLLRSAAVVISLLVTVGLYWFTVRRTVDDPVMPESDDKAWVSLEKGQRRQIVLPDGSEVWLNRGTDISYPEDFTANRTVRLDGEAYFSVVEQDGNPFTVMGADVKVTVLGTKFNIKTGKEKSITEVTLESGRVEVETPNKSVVLSPLQQLVYTARDNGVLLKNIKEEDLAPWRTTSMSFDETPLNNVFESISRYYGVTIGIDSRVPLEGTLRVEFSPDDDLEQVLFVIQRTSNSFDYKMTGDSVLITKR